MQHLSSNFLNPRVPCSFASRHSHRATHHPSPHHRTFMAIDALPIHHNTSAPPPPPPATNIHHHHRPFSLFTHFYWGKDAEILFSGWPGHNAGMYALALLFVFFSAVLVELFSNINVVRPGTRRVAAILSQMGIYAIRAGFAYLVMLSVISYNGGIFIAAVVGHAVGYVVFGSPISVFRKGSTNH